MSEGVVGPAGGRRWTIWRVRGHELNRWYLGEPPYGRIEPDRLEVVEVVEAAGGREMVEKAALDEALERVASLNAVADSLRKQVLAAGGTPEAEKLREAVAALERSASREREAREFGADVSKDHARLARELERLRDFVMPLGDNLSLVKAHIEKHPETAGRMLDVIAENAARALAGGPPGGEETR